MMSYDEIVRYIYDIPKFTKKRTMAQTKSLMDFFDNPQNTFKYIHIAGTNGKGSVSAMLEHCLRVCGFKTGLFTSPHLVKINERLCINGVMISDEDFTVLFNEVKEKLEEYIRQGGTHPTFFEILYLMAIVWFKKCGVEYAVIETGLGGRLDATNVIEQPILTVITSIGLDHMQYLGNTISQIAGEKAGIIKENVPVVYDDTNEEASDVILKRALECHAPAYAINDTNIKDIQMISDGYVYKWQTNTDKNTAKKDILVTLHMLGTYQLQNSAIAVMAMQQLFQNGCIPQKMSAMQFNEAVCQGIAGTRWAGRMEKVTDHLYIDGAHNDAGIKALVQTIQTRFKDEDVYLLFAVAEDKDYTDMIKDLCKLPMVKGVVVTALDNERRTDIDIVTRLFEKNGHAFIKCSYNIKEALAMAEEMASSNVVCCCGSLYLAGSIKTIIGG